MLVREVMTAPAYSLPRGTSLEAAVQLLGRARISAVPIVDEDNRVVGILSEADILSEPLVRDARAHLRPVADPAPWPETVDAVMTPDPVTVPGSADIAEVAQLFADTGWKSAPVVADGVLQGMVSRSDIIRALTEPDLDIRREVQHAFAQVGHPEWGVSVRAGSVSVSGVDPADEAAALSTAATVRGVRRAQLAGQETHPS